MDVVKLHLLLDDFMAGHVLQNVLDPRDDRFLSNDRRFARHQVDAILRPRREDALRVHLQVHVYVFLVERRNFLLAGWPSRASVNTNPECQQRNADRHDSSHAHGSPPSKSSRGTLSESTW